MVDQRVDVKYFWQRNVKHMLLVLLVLCSLQSFYAQEDDGVVSLSLPVRNSLKFNRQIIHPTFSFVREQHSHITLYNKREWVQFDDAPETYLAGYAGRFAENIGAGASLFQQNYGVLTTFGGMVNFAYNAVLQTDSNLTFGLNLGVYKSGLNSGKVITNFTDPSLDLIPSNILMTVSPGINYGTAFMDFGVSVNNLVLYNIKTSELLEDDPRQTLQAHVMYTGYVNRAGFFDQSKFSGMVRSEFGKEQTTMSAIAMLSIPKGIWAQVGYNTFYGGSAGLGLQITEQIGVEYNYEKALGDYTTFGPSHDLTLAYTFKNRNTYRYNDEDEMSGLFSTDNKRVLASSKSKIDAEKRAQVAAESEARREEIRQRAQEKEDTRIQLAAEAKARKDLLEARKLEAQAKSEQDAQERLAAQNTAKEEAEAKAREAKLLVQKPEAEQQEQTRLAAETQATSPPETPAGTRAEEEEKAQKRVAAVEKAKADAKFRSEAQAKLAAEAKAMAAQQAANTLGADKAKAEAMIKAEAETKIAAAKAKAEQEAKEKQAAEAKAKADALAKAEAEAKIVAAAKAKADQEAKEKLAAEAKAKAVTLAKAEAEAKQAGVGVVAAENALQTTSESEKRAIENPNDASAVSLKSIADLAQSSKEVQTELLTKFDEIVASKNQDLQNLKEENDLSERGIFKAPNAFKSITEENNRLEAVRSNLDRVIETNNDRIKDLETVYQERLKVPTLKNDEVTLYYQRALKSLKAAQAKAITTRAQLAVTLKEINEATEFERKRRIKRAAYSNEEDRYRQDRIAFNIIKQNTAPSVTPLKPEDFDFGEAQGNSIKIMKPVNNVESGYYVVVAVHTDVAKRDEFLTKALASGESNIDFFYDVNTSKYFIYNKKVDSIEAATSALQNKGNQPYSKNMSIIKIEN